ncbi:glycoside hydrolase family 2 protein [Thermophagus sp. OGC60D27]|uniref:glycoside hydrolase family 2 protein n=1 Tax=Thermophagus sp. OGC60D27 TaxID=3458415 RepID=UPI0040378D8B
MKLSLLFFLLTFSFLSSLKAQANRDFVNLSDLDWKIWLDSEAEWENDSLFLPPVQLEDLPYNRPTCGWSGLFDGRGKAVHLPATVEEHFWGFNGNKYGVAGNYKGVSWFFTEMDVSESFEGKRVVLDFESCRMRAEVFVNEQLVGYDLINGTPFSVDVSRALKYGGKNRIAVRITDPDGNFEWMDFFPHKWGNYQIPPSHGFGGITGRVFLSVTGHSYIEDVFVKNTPQVNSIDLEVSLAQADGKSLEGILMFELWEKGKADKPVVKKQMQVSSNRASPVVKTSLEYEKARLWSPEDPNLYELQVHWLPEEGDKHQFNRKIGFRWFEVKDVEGDKMFFLNGRRVVVLSSISWGFWPINGQFPDFGLAKKQIETAKLLGLNMLNFHRNIGHPEILDLADEMGLLYYAEPGGYKTGAAGSGFIQEWNRQKLFRMIRRDRNHPSLVIYNMINESGRDPLSHEKEDIVRAHKIDETRIITYTSTNLFKKFHGGAMPWDTAGVKMHMLPYDDEVHYYGWWDEHHPDGPGSYRDEFYNGPDNFHRNSNNASEIVQWGEDGAIGTPPRLQLMAEKIKEIGETGYDGDSYLKQYEAYNDFLDENEFRNAFPEVDDLTTSLGNVAFYYQGRIIENIRISNTVDGYYVNGWEGTKIENHSGIVDPFRNPKGDTKLISRYNQPLYVAVKVRDKVVEKNRRSVVDFYIVNEEDLSGNYQLHITAEDSSGVFYEKAFPVTVTGGTTYGELLVSDISLEIKNAGYVTVKGVLMKHNNALASGSDQIFAVDPVVDNLPMVAVYDTSEVVSKMLQAANIDFNAYDKGFPREKIIITAGMPESIYFNHFHIRNKMLEWVKNGNTLIVLDDPAAYLTFLNSKEIVDYRGEKEIRGNWFGGNFFNKKHPYYNGLPVNTAFNWEYQVFADFKNDRKGMRLKNGETVVGVYADHQAELYSALSILPCGKGKIVVTTLDFERALAGNKKASVVARRLLKNIIKY